MLVLVFILITLHQAFSP